MPRRDVLSAAEYAALEQWVRANSRDALEAAERCYAQGKAKRKHVTPELAKISMHRLVRLGTPGRLHIYPCPNCKQWHVGHVKNKKRRAALADDQEQQ